MKLEFRQVCHEEWFDLNVENGKCSPAPLRINVDGTAGTGKSLLIWSITQAIRELFSGQQNDLVARLAPTGIAAYGIRGWTLNFGLSNSG